MSFNTQPMRLDAAVDRAVVLARAGRRLVRVYRADLEAQVDCGSFVTSDQLLELRSELCDSRDEVRA